MTPADSVAAVSAVDTLFSDSLAQAGPKSLPADSSVHILSKRERKAQADSLKAQLRAQADSIASVKKAQAAAARKEKLAQIAKARQARATAKLDAAKQKEEALRRKNLERRAERMEKIWAKRRAKTGKAILKGKLPASALDSLVADSCGRPGLCRVGFFVPGLSCCGFAGTRFHAARFAQGRGCGSGLFAGIRSLHLLEIPSTGWSRGIAG